MTLRFLALYRLAPLALLLVSPAARAQDLFAPNGAGEDATAAPERAPAPVASGSTAPATIDEWWRAKTARPTRPPKPMALRFDGAYAPRRLFALGVTGTDLGLGLGVQTTQHSAWWATSRLSLGSTDDGLSVWSSRTGAEVEAVFDPIRFGIGASLLFIGVGRAARDQTLISYGLEVRAFGRVDIVRDDDYALFLRAGIDAGAEARGESTFWGPALGLGIELGVRGKRPEAWTAAAASASRSF
jgi:hypothetical protein